MSLEKENPFEVLSRLFVDNQRQLNVKTEDLSNRVNSLSQKLNNLKTQLNDDIFSANLIAILNIEEESRLILSVAKELEFQREQITKSVELLQDSKKIKLNK